jgi:arylsulfatase A-like enzyme
MHPEAGILRQVAPEWYRDNDHDEEGFIAASGPSIRARGALSERVDLLDIAPTCCSLLGVDPPADLDGRPIPWVAPARSLAPTG